MGLLVARGVGAQGVWLCSLFGLADQARVIGNVAGTALRVSSAPGEEIGYHVPFIAGANVVMRTGWWYNGATINGNVDVGIYDQDLRRVCSTGAIAQSGANAFQSAAFPVPGQLLAGRPYYLAVVSSSPTGTIMGIDCAAVAAARTLGIGQATSNYPLPAVFTNLTTTASQYLWVFGASDRDPV